MEQVLMPVIMYCILCGNIQLSFIILLMDHSIPLCIAAKRNRFIVANYIF